MLIYVLMFVAEGLLFMGVSIPLIQGRVKPNPWFGFRTPKTLSSPEIWYPSNAYTGRLLFKSGIAIVIGAIVLALLPGLNAVGYAFACVAVMMVSLIWTLVLSFRYLSKF